MTEAEKPAKDAEPEHKSLMEALLAVQRELPKLEKSAVNPHFKSKYISLDTIMAEILPVLNKHGLVWLTYPGEHEGHPALRYELVHPATKGQLSATMLLLAAKDDPQGQGAAITYARRYSMTAVLGISADEDDDGNRATQARKDSRARQQEDRAAVAAPDPDSLLSDEQRKRMIDALTAKGLDIPTVMEEAKVSSLLGITVGEAKRVKAILDAA